MVRPHFVKWCCQQCRRNVRREVKNYLQGLAVVSPRRATVAGPGAERCLRRPCCSTGLLPSRFRRKRTKAETLVNKRHRVWRPQSGPGGRYSTAHSIRPGALESDESLWLVLPAAILLFLRASFQAVEYQPGYQKQECNRHDDENDPHTPEYVVLSPPSKCRL